MALRKVRDAKDAETCLAAAVASGMDRAAWAHANGVCPRSLNAWRVNLTRGNRSEVRALQLVELVSTAEPTPLIVVRCGPFSVEVGATFDEHFLGRVLAVVAAC